MKQEAEAFVRLLNIMDELRAKCPWDMKQTMESLRHLTIEETYELTDAILEDCEKNPLCDPIIPLIEITSPLQGEITDHVGKITIEGTASDEVELQK